MGFHLIDTWNGSALRLKVADLGYWLRITLLIVLGMLAARLLNDAQWWRRARYEMYGLLLRMSQSPPTYPSWTAVVMIDDEDYWKGEWARRTPLKRDTLAKLLRQISAASPWVIAVDLDLRSHTPDGRVRTHSDYVPETRILLDAIREASEKTKIVLPKTIGFDRLKRAYVIDADLFDGIDLGPNVRVGYTRVPADLRNLALPTEVDGRKVDSFAAAAAAFVEPRSVRAAQDKGGEDPPFSMFLRADAFEGVVIPAGQVLSGDPAALSKLKNKVVIVGGRWHRLAFNRGDRVDQHLTPVGTLSGAVVHANYIEALLAQRSFSPSFHWIHVVFEVLVGFTLAAIFAAARGAWKAAYIAVLGVLVAIVSVAAFQNLGVFFDGVPAIILLGGHAAVETVSEWKAAHDAHEQCPVPT